jgi:hypothetical protein
MINLSRKPVSQFTSRTQERAGPLIRRVALCPVLTRHFTASARVLPEQMFMAVNGGDDTAYAAIDEAQRLKLVGLQTQ